MNGNGSNRGMDEQYNSVPNTDVAQTNVAFSLDDGRESPEHTAPVSPEKNSNPPVENYQNIEADVKKPDCGIGLCRPQCMQPCANIKMFVLFLSLLSGASSMLSSGYTNSVITTIEKRFEIGSSTSGLIAASYEIGSLIVVIFVSYLGSRRHIPVWIGLGTICMALAAYLFFFPHILADKYTISDELLANNNRTKDNICLHNNNNLDEGSEKCVGETSGNWVYILILVMAQVLLGTGSTPIFTLGTAYIDNHVPKEKAPAFLAFVYAVGALGPVAGFALGALVLQYYVDIFFYDEQKLSFSSNDPRWIGAWWTGYLVSGTIFIVLAIPFFAFPKILKCEKEKVEKKIEQVVDSKEMEERMNFGMSAKDIPKSIWNLLRNPVYLLTCLGACCEVAIVAGFVVFLPKYLEKQFVISKSYSNLMTGGIAIPGAVIGIMTGGFVMKKFQIGMKGALQLTIMVNILAVIGLICLLFIGCDNMKLAGATFPYFNRYGHEVSKPNLTSFCNMGCNCSPNDVSLVCGADGITYFSPCFAGCSQIDKRGDLENTSYSLCSCINANQSTPDSVVMSPMATYGSCSKKCYMMYPFLVLLFFLTFLVAATQMPLLMVTMRSVKEEERSFCLGIQFVLLRLLGYIPSPIVFGNVIDSTCLHWTTKCNANGSCLIYDIEMFRYKYIGISAGLKVIGAIFFTIVWFIVKRRAQQARRKLEIAALPSSASVKSFNDGEISVQKYTIRRDATQESFISFESKM